MYLWMRRETSRMWLTSFAFKRKALRGTGNSAPNLQTVFYDVSEAYVNLVAQCISEVVAAQRMTIGVRPNKRGRTEVWSSDLIHVSL